MPISEEQEQKFQAFIAAGNTVHGRPAKIIGSFSIRSYKSGSTIEFSSNVTLNRTVFNFELGGGKIIIGSNVHFRAWVYVFPTSKIIVGERTHFSRDSELQAWEGASITIGADCLFSNTRIRTCDSHSVYDLETNERVNPSRDVVIGNHVWLGEYTTINKGSRIGDGAIIASNSLVSGFVRPNCIAAGLPARVVRENIRWERKLDPAKPMCLPAVAPHNQEHEKRALPARNGSPLLKTIRRYFTEG